MSGTVIQVDQAGKKFCKGLQRSMLYGAVDILQSTFGRMPDTSVLRRDEFWAVDNVSFELKTGDTLGVIGANGSGKTTLLRLLNGIFMPDKGRIRLRGKVGALIQIGAGFHPMLSGRENIYVNGSILGMNKKEVDQKFDSIVDFAGIGDFLEAPVKHYSSGMFVRLGFAIAVHCRPDILLIDEVLSVGDIKFQQKCSKFITERLLKNGCTVIFVSHNRYAVQDLCERALYLNHGRMSRLGNTAEVMEHYLKDMQELKPPSTASSGPEWMDQKEGIAKIEFRDDDGRIKTQFQSGEKVHIRFYYSFKEKVARPSVGISFLHTDQRYSVVSSSDYLFNVHSGYDGLEIPILEGEGYFEATVEALFLPVGIYRYLTYLFLENNVNLVQKNETAGEIEILWSERSARRSLMDLPHRWDIRTGGTTT